jgi:chromosome segregation ATPase
LSAVLRASATESAPAQSTAVAPRERASQFHRLILEIEKAMGESQSHVQEIQERGVWRNLVSSSRDDLIAHANGQNTVNTLLLKLQREAISLNTLGYAYLTSLIAEFERQVNEGVRDSDGQIHVLSSKGKEVAQMATEMFNAILDTSESTQARIDANTAALAEHEQRFAELTRVLAEEVERTTAFEQFRLTSAQALTALGQQHLEVLNRLQSHERERAVMQAQIETSRDELSQAAGREVGLQRQMQRLLWTVWPAVGVTAGLAVATCARVLGWF